MYTSEQFELILHPMASRVSEGGKGEKGEHFFFLYFFLFIYFFFFFFFFFFRAKKDWEVWEMTSVWQCYLTLLVFFLIILSNCLLKVLAPNQKKKMKNEKKNEKEKGGFLQHSLPFPPVTNPPIDPIREEIVMSLTSYLGSGGNLLSPSPDSCKFIKIKNPILSPDQFDFLTAEVGLFFYFFFGDFFYFFF